MIETTSLRNIARVVSASKAVGTLLRPGHILEREVMGPTIMGNISKEMQIPLNTEDDTLAQFMKTSLQHDLSNRSANLDSPYWNPSKQYKSLDIFGGTIQFLDYHTGELPTTILPPQDDVKRYITDVMNSDRKLTVSDQFERLLDITNDNAVGAANLGFIASRLMYRGADTRAYPDIPVTADDLILWNDKIAQFEVYDTNSRVSSAPSDTYYFWTHLFASSVYEALNTPSARFMNGVFSHGSEIMVFVRRKIAHSPQNPHREASMMGRHIGLALADILLNEDYTQLTDYYTS